MCRGPPIGDSGKGFCPILADFRWGFADPGKQSADFVQFRADYVRFGVFANQTKSARPLRAEPFWEFPNVLASTQAAL